MIQHDFQNQLIAFNSIICLELCYELNIAYSFFLTIT